MMTTVLKAYNRDEDRLGSYGPGFTTSVFSLVQLLNKSMYDNLFRLDMIIKLHTYIFCLENNLSVFCILQNSQENSQLGICTKKMAALLSCDVTGNLPFGELMFFPFSCICIKKVQGHIKQIFRYLTTKI